LVAPLPTRQLSQNTLTGSLAGLTYPLLETQDEWVLHGFSEMSEIASSSVRPPLAVEAFSG
jgi:hypothetical protein